MTQVIYKYPLEVTQVQTIEVPQGGEVLSFQAQHNVPTLWIRHDKGAPTKKQKFMLISTGHEFILDDAQGSTLDYIGTCQMDGGSLVWHLFIVQPSIREAFHDMLFEKLLSIRDARDAAHKQEEENR